MTYFLIYENLQASVCAYAWVSVSVCLCVCLCLTIYIASVLQDAKQDPNEASFRLQRYITRSSYLKPAHEEEEL